MVHASGQSGSMQVRDAVDEFSSPFASFADVLWARRDDDTVFLIGRAVDHTRSEWTVAEWRRAVVNCAAQLSAAGVCPGDRVAVPSLNVPESLMAMFACWVANACCVPLDAGEARDGTWLDGARAAGCRFVATVRGPWGPFASRPLSWSGLRPIFLDAAVGGPPGDGEAGFDTRATALCLYSSGTTGKPKGINLTYDNLFANFDAMTAEFGWGPADRVITVLPISHGNGLLIGSLLPWFSGSSMVLCERFSSSSFWQVVEEDGATVGSVVPTVLAYLDADPAEAWPRTFREFVSGSGPLPRALAERVADRGPRVRQIYGLSETTCVATMTPAGPDVLEVTAGASLDHLVSVGPAVAHAEVAVLDQGGQRCAAGVTGELAVRGAIIMEGYYALSDARLDDNGWFRTGDEGAWWPGPDDRPWYYVTGRLKDLIIRGGLNISPLEIEDAMMACPGVDEVMAFGVPDEVLGEAVALAVVTASSVSEEALHDHARGALPRAKRPREIFFADAVPKTRSGKIRRSELARTLTKEPSEDL